MADIVLDTDGLADFLAQYFGPANRGVGRFMESEWLSHRAAQEINRIVDFFRLDDWAKDHVIASTFAFMEIARKWDQLIQGRFRPYQLRALLNDPDEWFFIASVDTSLIEFFYQLPATVMMEGGNAEKLEWTDAVHVATALSRNEPGLPHCRLRTRDTRIVRIELVANDCV